MKKSGRQISDWRQTCKGSPYIAVEDTTGDREIKRRINHALKIKYQHPKWQSLLLYPWMKEMAFQLSEVYSNLELEYATSRRILKDYPELFQGHGSRILVLGRPGIGKTTFTHKMALDWALKEFEKFESVFVVKLRDLYPDQSVCNAIALQYEDYLLPHESIDKYLTQSKDSVLLILDGLDEIDLKKYPQVNRILCGIDYPSCCVMTTSRPHISLEIKDEMSCIANITGFSKESAEKYVEHFIPDPEARREFFRLLAAKKIHDMYKVPIILQALAILYDDDKRSLPETYTATFNELVELISLKKIREGNTRLSQEDIDAAIEETNKLAFECLMKDKLVFPTDVIKNPDVLKLGILSVTKTVTHQGHRSLAQFPHKTLQDYAAAGHVANEYIEGRTGAWEKVKQIFSQLFKLTEKNSKGERNRKKNKAETKRNLHPTYTEEQQKNIITGAKKCIQGMMDDPDGRVAAIKRWTKVFLDQGFYDDDPDIPTLREASENLRERKMMNDDEFDALFDFGMELLSLADSEQKKKMKERANRVYNSRFDAWKFASILWLMVNWMEINPEEAMEVLSSTLLNIISSSVMVLSTAVTKQVQWLQDQANSTKTLFRFILGKLTRHRKFAEEILREIADLLLENAFDSSSGEVLSIHFIQQYLLDLMPEAGLSHEFPTSALYNSKMKIPQDFTEAPLIADINWQICSQHPDITKAKALSAVKIDNNFESAINQMENMQSLKQMELRDIEEKALANDNSKRLAEALSSTSLVSLVLDSIEDPILCTNILKNLPSSLQKLTMLHSNLSGTYQLPPEVKLESLHVEDVPGVSGIFSSTKFPHLKRITITGLKWKQEDIGALLTAVREERLSSLKHLCIRFGKLSKKGLEILEITQTCKLQSLDLMDTKLTEKDGQILLTSLKKGDLPAIQSLNLLHNSGINSLVEKFQNVAADQQIDIQCAKITEKDTTSWNFRLRLVCGSLCNVMCRRTRTDS